MAVREAPRLVAILVRGKERLAHCQLFPGGLEFALERPVPLVTEREGLTHNRGGEDHAIQQLQTERDPDNQASVLRRQHVCADQPDGDVAEEDRNPGGEVPRSRAAVPERDDSRDHADQREETGQRHRQMLEAVPTDRHLDQGDSGRGNADADQQAIEPRIARPRLQEGPDKDQIGQDDRQLERAVHVKV